MSSSAAELHKPGIVTVVVTNEALRIDLSDGRSLIVPLDWFPRLQHATPSERNAWRLIGHGNGIHWEALDEDISMDGLLAGRASIESRASFQRWLASRKG
jgi:hypothetical protein